MVATLRTLGVLLGLWVVLAVIGLVTGSIPLGADDEAEESAADGGPIESHVDAGGPGGAPADAGVRSTAVPSPPPHRQPAPDRVLAPSESMIPLDPARGPVPGGLVPLRATSFRVGVLGALIHGHLLGGNRNAWPGTPCTARVLAPLAPND